MLNYACNMLSEELYSKSVIQLFPCCQCEIRCINCSNKNSLIVSVICGGVSITRLCVTEHLVDLGEMHIEYYRACSRC